MKSFDLRYAMLQQQAQFMGKTAKHAEEAPSSNTPLRLKNAAQQAQTYPLMPQRFQEGEINVAEQRPLALEERQNYPFS